MIQVGKWRIDIVSGGGFMHDAGVLFGIVPKSIWQTVLPADSQNLVPLAMHCVLARNESHCVLIDTGHGSKLSPLDRKSHGLFPGWPLLDDLAALGVTPEHVDHVVLSHLHWDHSGGATSKINGSVMPTFPSAQYVVNRQEWADATSGQVERSGGYLPADFVPLEEAGVLRLVDHLEEVVPGVQVLQTGGHTLGHQAVLVESDGSGLIYLGDIAPTSHHIRKLWCTSYDLDLIRTREVKKQLFDFACQKQYSVVWNHDLDVPVSHIAHHPKREHVVQI